MLLMDLAECKIYMWIPMQKVSFTGIVVLEKSLLWKVYYLIKHIP